VKDGSEGGDNCDNYETWVWMTAGTERERSVGAAIYLQDSKVLRWKWNCSTLCLSRSEGVWWGRPKRWRW
jgi:hypothetical protein